MTEQAKKKYEEKLLRLQKTMSLQEPDRVPIQMNGNIYAIMDAGYTVAEVIYDSSLEKGKDAIIKYMLKYDPDIAQGASDMAGQGPILDLLGLKYLEWAGKPGTKISENSIQQILEFPILLDEEFDKFFSDRSGWALNNSMPKISRLCEPLADMKFPLSHHGGPQLVASEFSKPEMKKMIQTLWEVDALYKEREPKVPAVVKAVSELGYPDMGGGRAVVAFDEYSDTLRGTLLSLTDLYDYEDEVQRFIDEYHPMMLESIRNLNKDGSHSGKFVSMALHKGMDGFMSDEQYVKFYWRYLQEIICTIVDSGMIPYVFCEGRYSTRLKHLRDIPKGKVVYKFEDVPMELAKKAVGDVATITGGFSNALLFYGTKQQVIDECKKMIDDCAPGGGFIFQTKASLTYEKKENVDALFETIREYGKY